MLQNVTVNVIKKSDWNKINISVTYSIVIIRGDTQNDWCNNACFVTFLWLTLGLSLCHDFFLMWLVLQNVTDIVMTNSGWNKIMSASRALLWWSEASLKQLVRLSHAWWHCVQPTSWSVTWSRHIPSVMKQNEHVFTLDLTRQIIKTDRGRKHAHFVARAYAPNIFQECRD